MFSPRHRQGGRRAQGAAVCFALLVPCLMGAGQYVAVCNIPGSTLPNTTTRTDLRQCTDFGGTMTWIEDDVFKSAFLPDLSLSDGEAIAKAIIALWVTGFLFRQVRKHLNSM